MKPNRTVVWCFALTAAILFDHWKLFYPRQYSLLTGSEGVRQAYSWFNMWVRSVSHGSLPVWDPYALGGFSFPGEMQTAAFYPLNLVLLLFRPNRFGLLSALEYNSVFLAAYAMAALFMFALVRDLGLSRFAAFVAGFSFSSAGFVAHAPWPHMLESAVWLPLIALFWLRALRSEGLTASLRNAAFAGCFLGLSLLAGGLHIAIAQGIFLFCSGVFYAIVHKGPRGVRKSNAISLSAAFTVTALSAAGLAAIQLLPSHLYAQHSIRWVGDMAFPSTSKIPYPYETQSALSPVAVLSVLFPAFDGVGIGEVWTPYVGVLPLLFAAIAVAKQWSNPWVRFLLGLAIAAFLYSLAGSSALHGVLYVITPLLWMAREATRFLYLTSFCLAILAAYGLEYFCTIPGQQDSWQGWKRGLSLAIAGCLAFFLLPVFFPKAGGPWQYFSLFVILMSCVLLRYSLATNNLRMGPLFRLLVIGLLFFDLNAFNWSETNKQEADRTGQDEQEVLNSLKPAADYLKKQPQPFRVKVFHDPEVNIGDAYGVRSASGGGVTLDEYAVNVLHDAELMNTEYFVKPASASEGGAIFEDEHWKVYKNAAAFPHAWIVHSVKREQNEPEMLRDLKQRHSELRQTGFVAEQPEGPLSAPEQGGTEVVHLESSSVSDLSSASDLRLTVKTSSPGLLIVSEIYYPEWHARVNGREAKIVRADEALRSVSIPAGQSMVEFRYRPVSVYIGASFSVVTAGILFALACWRLPRAGVNTGPTPTG